MKAKIAADLAATAHNSTPVILLINPIYPLFPDEDWVVEATEHPKKEDFNWTTEQYKSKRYRDFFEDLFSEYIGEGHSLSDEYARRYDELNSKYKITYKDSLRYIYSVRQAEHIAPSQIINVE